MIDFFKNKFNGFIEKSLRKKYPIVYNSCKIIEKGSSRFYVIEVLDKIDNSNKIKFVKRCTQNSRGGWDTYDWFTYPEFEQVVEDSDLDKYLNRIRNHAGNDFLEAQKELEPNNAIKFITEK